MPSMGIERNWKLIAARRAVYAQKLRKLGIIEGSNKWRTLMCRKRL